VHQTRHGMSFGPFRIFPSERLLEKDGNPVPVGSRAFDLLTALVEKAGDIVGKEELVSRAWPDLTVDESSLRFQIAGLRKVLGDGQSGARYISNVAGRGYCLVMPTVSIDATPRASVARTEQTGTPHGLPRQLTRMVGRDETVRRINDHLSRKRFLTIHGPGGIGKTTVAVAVAHAQLDAFGGAVYFLDLGLLADPAFVSDALASALGLKAQAADPIPEIIDFLRERRALIVLDSCEHVIGAAAALAEQIHQDAPAVALLATSREPLKVEGEHVHELRPLERPPDRDDLTISQVLSFPATHLFADRAAASGYSAELTDADAAIVTQICRKLDGIALAIELVASRVAIHGLRETASLLDGRLRLLWRGRRTALPRHQTLNATLDWSYDLVSDVERTVLRRLSIFIGPFVRLAAEAVASDDDLDAVRIVEALEGLVSKSLVSVKQGAVTSQYRLLDTTRAYANVKLVESRELDRVSRSHAVYVCNALQEMKASPSAASCTQNFVDPRDFLGDVRASLKWSFSGQNNCELAVSLAAAAVSFFNGLSLLNESRHWGEAALSALNDAIRGTAVELQLQAALGHSLMFIEGNGEQARSALERALEIAERIGDQPNQFRLLSRLHMYYRRRGEISLLIPIARRLESLAMQMGDSTGIAAAHNLLGVSHHLVGDQHAAHEHLARALHLAEFQRVTPSHFAFHRNPYIALSRTLWLQGYPEQAIATAKPLATDTTTDVVTYCISLIWGAAVFEWVGDWEAVEELRDRLMFYATSHSLRPYQAVALGLQGESLIQAGQVDDGIDLLQRAITALRADQYELYTSGFGGWLAMGLATSGRVAVARTTIDDVLARVLLHGTSLELAELLRIRGEIQVHQGDEVEAISSFRQAIELASRQGALSWRLRASMSLARLKLCRDGSYAAHDILSDTYSHFTEGFATRDLMVARSLLDDLTATGVSQIDMRDPAEQRLAEYRPRTRLSAPTRDNSAPGRSKSVASQGSVDSKTGSG